MSVLIAIALASSQLAATGPSATSSDTPVTDVNPLAADPVEWRIRRELDGAGVSDLAIVGDTVIVVDPNQGLIHAYVQSRFGQPGRACRMPHTFAPWRTVGAGGSLRLVSEDERTTIDIRRADIDGWSPEGGQAGPCPTTRLYAAVTDSAPRFRRLGDPLGRTLVVSVPNPFDAARPAVIRAGVRGQVLGVKPIGQLSGGRFAVVWKELDQWPVKGLVAPISYGRVFVNVWVSMFDRRGRLLGNVRVKDHQLPLDGSRPFTGLSKRAFEYLAASTDSGADWLYVVDGREEAQVLRRFRLPGPAPAATISSPRVTATVRLFAGALPEPSQDPDAVSAGTAPLPPAGAPPARNTRDDWRDAVLSRVRAFADQPWRYPAASLTRPCGAASGGGGNDQCNVTLDEAGNLIPLTAGAPLLANQEGKPARWIGPRYLVGTAAGSEQLGLPYSYGGADSVDGFMARRAAIGSANLSPAIGNIRLTLSRTGSDDPIADYPLGIDCSAFIAAVFGVDRVTTSSMMTRTAIGPVGAYASPVPHLSQIRPGDVLVKKGHVVVFTGVVPIGRTALLEASMGYEVYEATSRCGRVCRSVYEPDFFNGWWIVRMPGLYDGKGKLVKANPNSPPPPRPAPGSAVEATR